MNANSKADLRVLPFASIRVHSRLKNLLLIPQRVPSSFPSLPSLPSVKNPEHPMNLSHEPRRKYRSYTLPCPFPAVSWPLRFSRSPLNRNRDLNLNLLPSPFSPLAPVKIPQPLGV